MTRTSLQLVGWFLATVVLGVLASLLAPTLESAMLHAQVARGTASVTLVRATHALQRGEILSATDFVSIDTVIPWHWNSSAPDTARVQAGWVVRRAIAEGEVLRPPAVVAAPVIVAGAAVTAIWQDGSVRVVLTGIATNSASLGATVGVRIDRNRRLDGVAVGPNTVRLHAVRQR